MAITLQQLVLRDTDYLNKHNSNYAAIQAAINAFETDYQPRSQGNVAGGYVTLDAAGKIPSTTFPDLAGYQLTSERGQPNGYAALDGSGKVAAASVPVTFSGDVSTFQLRSEKGTAGGYCGLDASGKVAEANLNPAVVVLWGMADVAGGFPKIDPATAKIQDRWVNLPDLSLYQALDERNAQNGYVGLDSNGRIPVSRFDLPALRSALGLPPG